MQPDEMQESPSGRGWLGLILTLYVLSGLVTSLLWPIWEEIDERRHYQRAFFYVYGATGTPRTTASFTVPICCAGSI